MQPLLVLSTFASENVGVEIARTLVEEGLAACVNLVPQVRSIYRWNGAVQDDREVLAVMKTTAESYDALAARLATLHPYECPEILAIPVAAGHAPYLAWLADSVTG